jgi:hypothetical protein
MVLAKLIRLPILAVMLASFVPLAACDRHEGPAERLGEKVDEGVKDTKRKVEDATD